MRTLEKLKSDLVGLNLRHVAREAGISYTVLQSVASGANDNPSLKTVEKIDYYLDKFAARIAKKG